MGIQSDLFDDRDACIREMLGLTDEGVNLSGVQNLASYILVQAFAQAQKEVRRDPYSLGPEQRFLMNDPIECDGYEWDSSVTLWCSALDLDYPTFRDRVSDLLDKLAEKVILDPERFHIPAAQNDDELDGDDIDFSTLILEMFIDLPVHFAPKRDVMRASRKRPKIDPRQTSFIDLLAA